MGQKLSLVESLSGGLVTSKDPAILTPGQLAMMQNAVYVRGSQALTRAPGRTVFGTVTGTNTIISTAITTATYLPDRDLSAVTGTGDHFIAYGSQSASAWVAVSASDDDTNFIGRHYDVGVYSQCVHVSGTIASANGCILNYRARREGTVTSINGTAVFGFIVHDSNGLEATIASAAASTVATAWTNYSVLVPPSSFNGSVFVASANSVTFQAGAIGVPQTLDGYIEFTYANVQTTAAATATASGAPGDIVGLRDIQFDNGDHFLIALANCSGLGRLRYAPVGSDLTGNFADVGNIPRLTGVEGLETTHFETRWFGFQGTQVTATDGTQDTGNVCLYLTATAPGQAVFGRRMGLLPTRGSLVTASATGTFSASGATGYYDYWVTEVANITQDGSIFQLESGAEGPVTTVFVSSTAYVPVIYKPSFRNPMSNRWRVYRSARKDISTQVEFPIGALVSQDISSTVSTFRDSQQITTSSQVLPSTAGVVVGGAPVTGYLTVTAADGVYARLTTLNNINGYSYTLASVYGAQFNFGGGISGLTGVEVEIKTYAQSATVGNSLNVQISPTDASSYPLAYSGQNYGSKNVTVTATSSGTAQTIVMGGATDMWTSYVDPKSGKKSAALVVTDTDVNSQRFSVVLWSSANAGDVYVDYIKVKLFSDGSLVTEIPFPTVVYTVGDTEVAVARNGPPPSSSIGDIYQDQLVVNDLSNASMIRYSTPGEPEYFPAPYYIDFETGSNDTVTMIKCVNSRLVVGLRRSVWRVAYLPSEEDATFDRGRSKEPISSSFGCVGPMMSCVFSPSGGIELLAFVSDYGIHVTDGYSFQTISTDLSWRTVIAGGVTSYPIALINHREQHELVLYYRNDTIAPETCLALRFNYSSQHSSDGKLKVSGPTHMRNYDPDSGTYAAVKSAWSVPQDNGTTLICLGYGESPTAPQYAHGSGDVAISTWLASNAISSGVTANLYSYIDEAATAISDTDKVYVFDNATGTYQVGLDPASPVNVYTDHKIRMRTRKAGASIGATDAMAIALYSGTAVVATRSVAPLSSGLTTYEWTLTKSEKLAITDYTTLSFKFTPTTTTTAGSGRFEVSWAEFEAPGIGYLAPGSGKVYVENGSVIPANDPAFMWRTRDIYHAGFGGEWKIDRLHNYLSNSPGRPTVAYVARSIKTNSAGGVPVNSPTYTLAGEKMHRVQFSQQGEGISVEMNVIADHDDMSDEFIVIQGESFGTEDSGL